MGCRLYQTQQIWLQNHTWHNFSTHRLLTPFCLTSGEFMMKPLFQIIWTHHTCLGSDAKIRWCYSQLNNIIKRKYVWKFSLLFFCHGLIIIYNKKASTKYKHGKHLPFTVINKNCYKLQGLPSPMPAPRGLLHFSLLLSSISHV